jgi:hypothetical protein
MRFTYTNPQQLGNRFGCFGLPRKYFSLGWLPVLNHLLGGRQGLVLYITGKFRGRVAAIGHLREMEQYRLFYKSIRVGLSRVATSLTTRSLASSQHWLTLV